MASGQNLDEALSSSIPYLNQLTNQAPKADSVLTNIPLIGKFFKKYDYQLNNMNPTASNDKSVSSRNLIEKTIQLHKSKLILEIGNILNTEVNFYMFEFLKYNFYQ
jgi:hypothetical protein